MASGSMQATRRANRDGREDRLGETEEPEFEVLHSEGAKLIGPHGKRMIDFTSGWLVGNLGWGDHAIHEAMRNYDGPDYVSPSERWRPREDLASLLVDLAPKGLSTCFRATGGTEAVEIALAAAILHTDRHEFISIEGCYHGDSLATTALAGDELSSDGSGLLFRVRRVKPPLGDRAAEEIERILRRGKTAAVVMEPVVTALGVEVPTRRFVKRVREACSKHGTVFVADEVATGFGRTGRFFACEHFDLEPDALCLAKSVTGGYEPMGATLLSPRLAKAMDDHPTYYSTYGWHPRAVVAALAAVTSLRRSWPRLERAVQTASRWFMTRLEAIPFARRHRIQGLGLAIAVHFDDEDYAETIASRAREEGLLVPHDDGWIDVFPPLTIDRATAKAGIERLERCV
jgi:acetylornithine/succinyldiaminopimelate/putrescine aminotransferase